VQEVKRLRAAGHDVEVLSPGPSAAHHHLDLRGPRGPLALARRVRAYDRVVVQFHPDVFYRVPSSGAEQAAVTAGLLAVARAARSIEFRVHEVDYDAGNSPSVHGRLLRALWRAADRVVVHTRAERDRFAAAFGLPPDRVELAEHGSNFVVRSSATRGEARARFGIPDDETMFLSIGFIQPHKGFDRAVRAFAAGGLGRRGCRLDVVGSVRVEELAYLDHARELRALADATPSAYLHEEYVGDEAFDAWIVASDVVVLPYRHIWSSSVLERARLYDRPVIATRVGGLRDQAPDGTTLVDDDDELAAALAAHAPPAAGSEAQADADAEAARPWPVDDHVDRRTVMAEVRERAAAERMRVAAGRAGTGGALVAGTNRASSAATAPLRRLPPLTLPPPVSARPGAGLVKQAVRRLTAWQVDPIVAQVNHLQQAVAEVLEPDGEGMTGSGGDRPIP
jgi:glycosyltransferase involved in cell wall biosynthesis